MARDIKDTPLLVGDDAVRFEIASHNVIPETKENIEKAKEDFEYLKSICVDDTMKDCERERAIACLKIAIELAGDGGMAPFTDKEYELMDNLIKEIEDDLHS